MADKEKGLRTTSDGVSFEKDPVEYCKRIYAEALRRQEDLRDINVENRAFYEGYDELIERRRNNPEVQRSAINVNEIKPAIDTRVSSVMTKLEERQMPLVAVPDVDDPTFEEKAQADWIARTITKQMRDCGYLSEGFKEHIEAAEVYRSPSTVKVDWEEYVEDVAVHIKPTFREKVGAFLAGRRIPEERVEWRRVRSGRPYVCWLDVDQFLYEPGVSDFSRSRYAIHADYYEKSDIMAMSKEFGFDEAKINKYAVELSDETRTNETGNESARDMLQETRDVPEDKGDRDGKYLLCEIYVATYNDAGEEEIHRVFFLGNKYIVKRDKRPHKGIRFPFVPTVANKLPGTIEGLSSVDLGKPLARLITEIYNTWVDATSYQMFGPLVSDKSNIMYGTPKIGLGQLWKMSDIDRIRPLIQAPSNAPDLTNLLMGLSPRLRQILNAEDIQQGFQSTQYEKATSTKLRMYGAERRNVPLHKRYGEVFLAVARMFLQLNRQYHPQAELFTLAVRLDVPSLTNITDPDQQKQDELLLYSTMQNSPLYQTPDGMRKLRNQMETIIRLFKDKHMSVDDFVPTKQELDRQLGIAAEQQQIALEKQDAMEQYQLESANAQGAMAELDQAQQRELEMQKMESGNGVESGR